MTRNGLIADLLRQNGNRQLAAEKSEQQRKFPEFRRLLEPAGKKEEASVRWRVLQPEAQSRKWRVYRRQAEEESQYRWRRSGLRLAQKTALRCRRGKRPIGQQQETEIKFQLHYGKGMIVLFPPPIEFLKVKMKMYWIRNIWWCGFLGKNSIEMPGIIPMQMSVVD